MVRINLSDQTDISDLFGSDLPVEGGAPGQFSWVSGPFLAAMERGDWILLDELNLASQSVVEGLIAMWSRGLLPCLTTGARCMCRCWTGSSPSTPAPRSSAARTR